MTAHDAEGVIRFESLHRTRPLDPRVHGETAATLSAWREMLARLDLIGQDPARYGGYGYGNASARIGGSGAPRGRRPFLVTGSQTGGRARLTLDDYALVEHWDLDTNCVESVGSTPPSSESLTHGALYDVAPSARAVLHAHTPEIWRNARLLGIPLTRDGVANGTPEMAAEVHRLYRETAAASLGIVAMGGHEDGVIAFGASAAEAGAVLVRFLARALEMGT